MKCERNLLNLLHVKLTVFINDASWIHKSEKYPKKEVSRVGIQCNVAIIDVTLFRKMCIYAH